MQTDFFYPYCPNIKNYVIFAPRRTLKFTAMAKITKTEYREILRQKMDLFNLILKKTGITQEDVLLPTIQEFINENMDVLNKTELKRFNKLIFNE